MNSLIYSSHAHREKHVRPPISRAAHTTPAQRPADRPHNAASTPTPHALVVPAVAPPKTQRRARTGQPCGASAAGLPQELPSLPPPAWHNTPRSRPGLFLPAWPHAPMPLCPPLHTPRLPCTPGRFRPGYCERCTSWPDIVICGRAPAGCSVAAAALPSALPSPSLEMTRVLSLSGRYFLSLFSQWTAMHPLPFAVS